MIYFLIPLVIVIWGMLFLKIYSNFGHKKQVFKNNVQKLNAIKDDERDSIFTLVLNYPDPFLKGTERKPDLTILSSVEKNSSISVVNWPVIEYRGFMGKNNDDGTGLLKIGESNLLVKHGQVYSGVKICSITKDSISVEFENVRRWITKLK